VYNLSRQSTGFLCMAVAGQIVTFAERVAHEVWIEEAGNRDGLGGGWETKKLWKPLRTTDNLGRREHI
jgi:hypothetical protein